MNADFYTFLAMPKENIGTHAATCDRVVQFFLKPSHVCILLNILGISETNSNHISGITRAFHSLSVVVHSQFWYF